MRQLIWMFWIFGCTTSDEKETEKTCIDEDTFGDGIDSNCDGIDGIDDDQDGFASLSSGGDDCNDVHEEIYPQATEICDGLDNNCDALIDDEDILLDINSATVWFVDGDMDGYGSDDSVQTCTMPSGYVENQEDCNDSNENIHPQATEICDGLDNNCDALIDDEDTLLDINSATTWFADIDRDGQGNTFDSVSSCLQPNAYVDNDQDCDDTQDLIFFGNAIMELDLGCYQDLDEDGYGDTNPSNTYIDAGEDCNDTVASINPNATDIESDGIDQDCDGSDSLHLMSDFSLPDINPQSSSFGQTISVRDQLQQVSGWYFIKAT